MAKIETVRIVNGNTKSGYMTINKSDLKKTDKVYDEKEEKSHKPKKVKGEKHD